MAVTDSGVRATTWDTTALVTAAQGGDEAALTQLLAMHLPLVYNIIGRALNGHADVDDLVQETMVQAMRSLRGLREPERFRSWLVTIAYRQIQAHRRSRQRLLLRRQEVPTELPDPRSDFAERTVTELMLTGQRRELAEAARWLDDDDRHLLALYWQEAAGELTRAEMAAALTVNPKHAGVRVQRMKAHLDGARAVVRALGATPRCPDLAAITRTWNGEAAPIWRKRLTRHVRDCRHCQPHRHGLVAPEKLLLGAASVTVAASIAISVRAFTESTSVWASVQGLLSKKAVTVAAMTAIATGGGFVYAVNHSPITPDEPPAAVRPTTTATATEPAIGAPAVPSPATSAAASKPAASSTALIGWATQGGGTTGGAGGGTVTVTTLADLTAQASSAAALTIRVSGSFTCSEDVRVAANKTIFGVGAGSGLTGCGLNIRDTSNVIVRNLNIAKVKSGNGNGDAIHIDNASRVWLDHNDLSSDLTSGNDAYDGLLDISHGADYITVSWNKLHDHLRCSLVGHSDSNASEDTGHLRITYHHNLFSNCGQRSPRVRFGNPVHVFNNYYTTTTTLKDAYGIATTCDAGVLLEGNYFENIAEPTHIGEDDSPKGNLVARDNVLVNSGAISTNGNVAGVPYGYAADAAGGVKASVIAGAGTGKITA